MKKRLLTVLLVVFLCPVLFAGEPIHFTRIDKNHSTIGFSVPILAGMSKVTGKFTDFSFEMVYDESNPENSSVKATIQMASIDTGIEDRDKHLRSGDFFEVAKFPQATFISKSMEKKDGKLIARGDFTLKGVSKEIEVPFTITGFPKSKNEEGVTRVNLGVAAEFTINRLDYNIKWQHSSVPNWVSNEITLEINLITRSHKLASN
ncbi:YceI family protein [candidate division KSB1 bacterium]|nr:YceI family protein [candidate division KSB1 bacterium]